MPQALRAAWTRIGAALKGVPPYFWYILILLVVSRVTLTGIGMMSRWTMLELTTARPSELSGGYSDKLWLDVWAVWDSGWYLDIAQRGYSAHSISKLVAASALPGQYNYAYFPLYPMLMRAAGSVLRGDYCLGGFLVSNLSLAVALVFLYKLVSLEAGPETARRSVRYLLLFPMSFFFSGVFTESLFLMLAVICFYAARKGAWFWVGVAGFFLTLTRSIGLLVLLPLLVEYLAARRFRLRQIRSDILWLGLLPLGMGVFMAYTWHLTGDWLAFYHVQAAWGHRLVNPLGVILQGLTTTTPTPTLFVRFPLGLVAVLLILTVLFCRRLPASWTILSLLLIVLPLLSNEPSYIFSGNYPRYAAVAFPVYIVLAKITSNRLVDAALMTASVLLLGFMMSFWCCGSMLVY